MKKVYAVDIINKVFFDSLFLIQIIWRKTNIAPKSPENFFESGGFTMGRWGYLKHEYYFSRPRFGFKDMKERLMINLK